MYLYLTPTPHHVEKKYNVMSNCFIMRVKRNHVTVSLYLCFLPYFLGHTLNYRDEYC